MITVRPAELDDGEALARIDLATWTPQASPVPAPSALEYEFFGEHASPEDVLVATDRGVPVGYVRVRSIKHPPSRSHVVEIGGLAVDPARQGEGVARRLVEAAVEEATRRGARKVSLRVLGPNVGARRLYERCGFVIEGVPREEFLLEGRLVDDVFMARHLGAAPGGDRSEWVVTTHDWSQDADAEHLADARRVAESLGDAMALHLVLEVLAYADDEAAAVGRRGAVVVAVRGTEVEVADDGRGTDTRRDDEGRVVRKPVMATRDVRFFDVEDAPLLPDGLPRRGMSLVAAASPLLLHENRRIEGSWAQAYEHGIPVDQLREGPSAEQTGTTVTFRLPSSGVLDVPKLTALAEAFQHLKVLVQG